MNKTINYRPIEGRDYQSLQHMICDTWGYEKLCSPAIAKQMSKVYLAGCMMEQTFTCVAEYDGEAVGVIMCQNNRQRHRSRIKYVPMLLSSMFDMLSTKEGREIQKMFSCFNKIDRDLLCQSGKIFDGQLAFFALCSEYRGKGIGKELWERGIKYFQEQGIEEFYLYTDTTCNYGFYEHQGMMRIGEKRVSLKPQFDREIEFYLYGYTI